MASISFTIGQGTTQCGGKRVTNPDPVAPFSGELDDATDVKRRDLGVGCLYMGGGNLADIAVLLREVNRAPIGETRDAQSGQIGKRHRVVQRRVQQDARLRQELTYLRRETRLLQMLLSRCDSGNAGNFSRN